MPKPPETFRAELIQATKSELVFANRIYPRNQILIDGEVVAATGDIAIWFLQKGECWDIASVYSPEGKFRGYYVDATERLEWSAYDGSDLSVIDLFLDLHIWSDLRYVVLDEDELADALNRKWISDEQAELARATIAMLEPEIRAGTFPPQEVRDFRLSDPMRLHLSAIDFQAWER